MKIPFKDLCQLTQYTTRISYVMGGGAQLVTLFTSITFKYFSLHNNWDLKRRECQCFNRVIWVFLVVINKDISCFLF